MAYSACVRAHGVPNFPDPKISTNGNEVKRGDRDHAGDLGQSPFQVGAAGLPQAAAGRWSREKANHQITPSEQSQYLKAAACIRSHGVPNFPDPTFSGGGVHIAHQGLNESSPAFKAAVQACESLIPGGVHGDRGASARPAPAPAP